MGKSNALCNSWLNLDFNAAPISQIADSAASSPFANLWVSLHTANPGAAGTQLTNEAAYVGYQRVALTRTTGAGGWYPSTGQVISPNASITFPAATGGSETETYFGIGTTSSTGGVLHYSGTVTPNIAVSNGVTPQLTTGSTIAEA